MGTHPSPILLIYGQGCKMSLLGPLETNYAFNGFQGLSMTGQKPAGYARDMIDFCLEPFCLKGHPANLIDLSLTRHHYHHHRHRIELGQIQIDSINI